MYVLKMYVCMHVNVLLYMYVYVCIYVQHVRTSEHAR